MGTKDKYGMDPDNPIVTVAVPPTCTCQWTHGKARGTLDMLYANPWCRLHRVALRRVTMTVEDGKNDTV